MSLNSIHCRLRYTNLSVQILLGLQYSANQRFNHLDGGGRYEVK